MGALDRVTLGASLNSDAGRVTVCVLLCFINTDAGGI